MSLARRLQPAQNFHVGVYGAKCDGRVVSDATMTSRTGAGNVTVGSATMAFTQADVGKRFAINPTTAVPAYSITHGYIVSVDSLTSVTAYVPATVSAIASAGSLLVASDDSVAVTAAIAAATAKGGDVYFPPGICGYGSAAGALITVPAGVNLRGAGKGRGDPFRFVSKGSVLSCVTETFASSVGFVLVSGSGCELSRMSIECNQRSDYCVRTTATLIEIDDCTLARASTITLNIGAGTCQTQNCYIYNGFRGICVDIPGDCRLRGCDIYGSGDALPNVNVNSPVDDVIITDNHIYKGGWTVTLSSVTGPNIRWYQFSTTDSGGGVIGHNTFDTCEGNHIEITVFNSSASLALKALTISANQFYQPQAFTTNTYSCIKVKVGSGGTNNVSLRALSVTGNVGKGYAASSRAYKSFIDWDIDATYGTVYGDSISGNSIDNCNALYTGGRTPDYSAGNTTIAGVGTVVATG